MQLWNVTEPRSGVTIRILASHGSRPLARRGSSEPGAAADTRRVTGDGEEPRSGAPGRGVGDGKVPSRPVLQRVSGPLGRAEPPPDVHLHREFKGLTVADLLRHEVVDRLPGQVRSALHHLQRGDLQAAERAMPGEFAPILPGPGHRRAERLAMVFWLSILAVVTAAVAAAWWF